VIDVSVPGGGLWWVAGLLAVLGAVAAAVTRRDERILAAMSALVLEGAHAAVLDHRLPSPLNRRAGRAVQATSAVLTGQFARALRLLVPATRAVCGLRTHPADEMVRAAALLGLGRYEEAAALLGNDPNGSALRRLRARAAVELGDDLLAERLLEQANEDPLDEAGRRRVLGDLRLRRGRHAEGGVLLREARAMYATQHQEGTDVDEAYCWVLLGRSELRRGAPAGALELLTTGLRGLARRPHNAPGVAQAQGLLAEAAAAVGDAESAADHLREASRHAQVCDSPAVDAFLSRAEAMVALRLGDRVRAGDALRRSIAQHERLGAAPAVG
jgi:tetratricopeptide (TPR) repeat protein